MERLIRMSLLISILALNGCAYLPDFLSYTDEKGRKVEAKRSTAFTEAQITEIKKLAKEACKSK